MDAVSELSQHRDLSSFDPNHLREPSKFTRKSIQQFLELVRSPEFEQSVREGYLTLALIKPDLANGMSEKGSDTELASLLYKSIQAPLTPIFTVSLMFTQEMVDLWYAGKPRDSQLQAPPIQETRYGKHFNNRWEEYTALMMRGPSTFILLQSPDRNAVMKWRKQMGDDWNIRRVKNSQPQSLRAHFGVDNHNNLLHGSDSPDSALKEIRLLCDFLQKDLQAQTS